jgi:hypothetical protein
MRRANTNLELPLGELGRWYTSNEGTPNTGAGPHLKQHGPI